MSISSEPLLPFWLVTVSVAVYSPTLAKVWTGFCSVLFEPSPKSQLKEKGPPLSSSTDAVNCTLSGGAPSSGSASAITSSSYSSSSSAPAAGAVVVGPPTPTAVGVGAEVGGCWEPPQPARSRPVMRPGSNGVDRISPSLTRQPVAAGKRRIASLRPRGTQAAS